MKTFFERFSPLETLYVVLGLAAGLAAGIGFFTFFYAKGASYLSNNPEVCMNCHVMRPQYDGWVKSTHHAEAVCNDCHTPHNFFGKYYVKARNGFWHSFYFTTGLYPDNIRITPGNRKVAESNCRRCHGDVVQAMDGLHERDKKLACVGCHGTVGHP
ncbi:MAG: cytochrome c nitrite reductase small subunit [Elusimicrobia bacterium]|nr:cytochrome c nitrite reductase small subunit [Elusimicrobiota bacterium]